MTTKTNTLSNTSAKRRQIKRNGAEVVYEDAQFIVIHTKTREANRLYGKGTKWCTAARENNLFRSYHTRGKLYIIIDKNTKAKYQFHFESKSYKDAANVSLTRESPLFQSLTPGLRAFLKSLTDAFIACGITFYNGLRACYDLWADCSELEEFYEKCMDFDPDYQVKYVLAIEDFYSKYQKSQEAVAWYSKFLYLKSLRIYANLGYHYHQLGMDAKAISTYKKALQLFHQASSRDICFRGLGDLFFERNNYAEALKQYERVEKNSSDDCLQERMLFCKKRLSEYPKDLFM